MSQERKLPGPEPERLKLAEDDWEEAVKEALKRPKPKVGWPKPVDSEGESEEPVSAEDDDDERKKP
jgi:hypothetical protein